MFIDELEIFVKAGSGGSGCTSFRREKYVEFGGPDGGDGGDGGSIRVVVRTDFNTLLPLRSRRHYRAGNGTNGKGANMTGARGEDLVLEVPPGTLIRDRETGVVIGDLTRDGDSCTVAKGGRGGKGNRHFASATMRTPRFSQPGQPGEELWLRLELRMLADVGLVGFPNAGKSTLISRISAAKPKVADYPFTTLRPSLGVVAASAFESFVVADIPGIIEGAHEGAGLGLRFLRHIERTSLLLMLVDPVDPERDPLTCYEVLRRELESYSPRLAEKAFMVAFTKADIVQEPSTELIGLQQKLEGEAIPWLLVSSVRGDGIRDLVRQLHDMVKLEKQRAPEPAADDLEPEPEPPSQSTLDPLDEI